MISLFANNDFMLYFLLFFLLTITTFSGENDCAIFTFSLPEPLWQTESFLSLMFFFLLFRFYLHSFSIVQQHLIFLIHIQKLSENQEYRKMQIRRKELLEHYPIIEKVIDDEGKVSISEQEHKALLEYFLVKDRMENEERLYHYLYGHIHCYEYMKKIGVIKHENQ